MKARMLAVFLLLGTLPACAQHEIEWRASVILTASDFEGTPVDTIQGSIHPEIELSFHLNTLHLFRKNYTNNVKVLFSKKNSFIRSADSTSLAYAQCLFNLGEAMARELRKEFSLHRHKIYSQKAHDIYDSLALKYKAIRKQYEEESEFGTNAVKQEEWRKWIEGELFLLSGYDKYPDDKKAVPHNGPPRYQNTAN